jgi:hypothetical protein
MQGMVARIYGKLRKILVTGVQAICRDTLENHRKSKKLMGAMEVVSRGAICN